MGRRIQIRLPDRRGYIRTIRQLQLGIQGADKMRVGFELAPLRPAVGRFLPLQEGGGVERSCAYVLKNPRRPKPNAALFFARACSMFLAAQTGAKRPVRSGAACSRTSRQFQLPGVDRQEREDL